MDTRLQRLARSDCGQANEHELGGAIKLYLHVEVTADSRASAIAHMRMLIDMMEGDEDRPGWSTSDRNGSSMAEWIGATPREERCIPSSEF